MINFDEPNFDYTLSFPCTDKTYLCYYINDAFIAVADAGPIVYHQAVPQIRPGKNFYITLYQYNAPVANCSYTIQAQSGFSCPNVTVLLVGGANITCSNYTTVTSNGQSFSGIASSPVASTNVFRIDVPKNVTLVYAWVTTPATTLVGLSSGGFASYSSAAADYYLQYAMPDGDYPVFFSITSSSMDASPFNITFYWEYCGATNAGYGVFQVNTSTGLLNSYEPPCHSAVQFPNMNFGSTQNYTFNVPAFGYNNTVLDYGSSFGFLEIPFGTYGAVNLSCFSSVTSNYVAIGKNQDSDCDHASFFFFRCNGGIFTLLSQDLYTGGYWTFAACNIDDQNPHDITLAVSGSVTSPPSPSPVPSKSPSTSPSTTPSITPSITPSSSPTSSITPTSSISPSSSSSATPSTSKTPSASSSVTPSGSPSTIPPSPSTTPSTSKTPSASSSVTPSVSPSTIPPSPSSIVLASISSTPSKNPSTSVSPSKTPLSSSHHTRGSDIPVIAGVAAAGGICLIGSAIATTACWIKKRKISQQEDVEVPME